MAQVKQDRVGAELLLDAVLQSPLGFGFLTPDGLFQEVNPALCELVGYTAEELRGRGVSLLLPFLDWARLRAGWEGRRDGQIAGSGVALLQRRDERLLLVEYRGHVVRHPDGSIAGVAGSVVPLTMENPVITAQQQLATMLLAGDEGYVVQFPDGSIADANDAFCRMAGLTHADLLAGSAAWQHHPDDEARVQAILRGILGGTSDATSYNARYLRPDGSQWWASISVSTLLDAAGSVTGVVQLVRDITDDLISRTRLRPEVELWGELVRNSPSGYLVVTPDGGIVDCNQAFRQLADQPDPDLRGRQVADLVQTGDQPQVDRALRTAGAGAPARTRVRIRRRDDSSVWVDFHLSPITDATDGVNSIGVLVIDASAEMAARERARMAESDLLHRSTHDNLTGVLNRGATRAMLAAAIDGGADAVLLFCDVDGFKAINDHLGHQAGDDVLREVANRLRSATGTDDDLGRLGGDEFAVLVRGEDAIARAGRVADAVLAAMHAPIHIGGATIHLSASIGLADATGLSSAATTELLQQADLAMYAAKVAGGDRAVTFTPEMGQEALAESELRHALTAALRAGEFDLDFQPIVRPRNGELVGVEALVRWVHQGRRVSAGTFIRSAEHTGQVVQLGRQVVHLLEENLPDLFDVMPQGFVNLNLSAKELSDPQLTERLRTGPLARVSHRIFVEVTESLELLARSAGDRALSELRKLGYRLAIDDFGTGFSSFHRLSELRPDMVKIDRSLVVRAGSDQPDGDAFLVAASGIARALGCPIVAEGVETDAEHESVVHLDIDFAQGYRYARPAPLNALAASADGG